METNSVVRIVSKFRQKVELAKIDLKKDLGRALRTLLDEVFNEIPTLQKLRWIQETDVWNDETYEFGLHGSLYIQITDTDSIDCYEIKDGFISIEPGYGWIKDTHMDSILDKFYTGLSGIEDELEYVFGSAKITASRDSDDLDIEELN